MSYHPSGHGEFQVSNAAWQLVYFPETHAVEWHAVGNVFPRCNFMGKMENDEPSKPGLPFQTNPCEHSNRPTSTLSYLIIG